VGTKISPTKLPPSAPASNPSLIPAPIFPPLGTRANAGKPVTPQATTLLTDSTSSKTIERPDNHKQTINHPAEVAAHTLIAQKSYNSIRQENIRPLRQPVVEDKGTPIAVTHATMPYQRSDPAQKPVSEALSALKQSALPKPENRAHVQFNLPVPKGARISVTKENVHANDTSTQSAMAKTLGGLGKSKWA
jgi:hypothetical protein